MKKPVTFERSIKRLADSYGIDEETGCWLWLSDAQLRAGYGRFYFDGRRHQAHRFVYELLVGSVPEGMELDHLCRIRRCVNPAHLEPVTGRVNILRGVSPSAVNAAKSHCSRGHELTGDNLVASFLQQTGGRRCRICDNERMRSAYRESNPDRGLPNALKTHCPKGHEYTPENLVKSALKKGWRVCLICQRQHVRDSGRKASRKRPPTK